MDKNIAYTIGILNGSNYVDFIGWNHSTDYYDTFYSNCLESDDDWCFNSMIDESEAVTIYKCDTIEEAQIEQQQAQREFDEKVSIIKMSKSGICWYPVFNENEV